MQVSFSPLAVVIVYDERESHRSSGGIFHPQFLERNRNPIAGLPTVSAGFKLCSGRLRRTGLGNLTEHPGALFGQGKHVFGSTRHGGIVVQHGKRRLHGVSAPQHVVCIVVEMHIVGHRNL